ncbi:MAG: rhodanese-like domain-containing protein [Planctomycetes bacterium]|nr:rhodanese-like domain-containing protein [Planctomycetota bacterium]
MTGFLLRTLAILLVASAAGAGSAYFRSFPWLPDHAEVAAKQERQAEVQKRHETLRSTVGVSLAEFRKLIDEGALIIDARPREEFEKGHLRLDRDPPVLNVPPAEALNHISRLNAFMGLPIAIYCTSEICELGEELYVELEKFGFSGIKIYFAGYEGLQKAGMPTIAGPDAWDPQGGAPTVDSDGASTDESGSEKTP